MNRERNQIGYGCFMDEKEFKKLAEEIKREVLEKIDFKNGVLQEVSEEKFKTGYVLDVRWKKDVHFILYVNRWSGKCLYYATRKGEQVSSGCCNKKCKESFFDSVQHLVKEIDNGDFDHKKTESEKIDEIIKERNLTGCMNNTKWKEFIKAINEEMSVLIPCDYLTLFGSGPLFINGFDDEHLGCKLKAIEWVKVKPKFYISKHRGRLMDDEEELWDVEQELLDLMNKYTIPYEYDSENEVYTIYGYK